MRRLIAAGIALVVGLGVFAWRSHHVLTRTRVPATTRQFTTWNGYDYAQATSTRFEVEGTITSISPSGHAFCSGPLVEGPGTSFTLRRGGRKSADVGFSAFGVGPAEAQLRALSTGTHVRLVGTEGVVTVSKDGQQVLTVESQNTLTFEQVVAVIDTVELQ